MMKLKNGIEAEFRELEAKDAQSVLDYLVIVGKETTNLLIDEEGLGISIEEEEQIIERYRAHSVSMMLGCFVHGRLVAVSNLSSNQRKKIMHVANLGVSVLKEYWGIGIGKQLMNMLIDHARQTQTIKIIRLDVRADNEKAIHLYKKLGFKEIGYFKKAFVIHGEYYDEIMMNLYLE